MQGVEPVAEAHSIDSRVVGFLCIIQKSEDDRPYAGSAHSSPELAFVPIKMGLAAFILLKKCLKCCHLLCTGVVSMGENLTLVVSASSMGLWLDDGEAPCCCFFLILQEASF